MNFLIIILAGIGLANAIVREWVFEWLRRLLPSWKWLQELFGCVTCMSFWTTLGIALLFHFGWLSIPMALTASILARIETIWENN